MASNKRIRLREGMTRGNFEKMKAGVGLQRFTLEDENRDGFIAQASDLGHRSQGRNQIEQLDVFYDQSLITSVEGIIKIGKEASAYRCRAGEALGGGFVVAKVYRAKQYRFKNDAVYQEGRERMLSGRIRRSLAKKTGFGREVHGGLWVKHEWETLHILHGAGVHVPQPLASAEDALLMQYFGDEDEAAPQLNRVRLGPEEASRIFKVLLSDVETMLACHLVHGDLSPHNVLYWQGVPVIIDLPQAVDPRFNSQARELFLRDISNVCGYFKKENEAHSIGTDLWARYELGAL